MPPIALSHDAGSGSTTSAVRTVAGPTFALTPEDRFAEYDPTRGRLLADRAVGRATYDSRRGTGTVPE